jgi:hypothetical protein
MLGEKKTHNIMRGKTGNERIEALFRETLTKPVSRDIVQAVAQQKDYMKRLRKNGGARDALAREGIAILSKFDTALIKRLGLPPMGPDEFVSFKPVDPGDIALLRAADKID